MKTRTVYLFDAGTGEYKGIYEAQENPLEPGVFIEPTHSTAIAPPPAGANEAAVFASGAWALLPDYRGQVIYDQTSGATQHATEIGALPSGFEFTPPPPTPAPRPTLAQVQDAQRASLSTACRAAVEAGFVSPALGEPHRYGGKPADQSNIALAALKGGSLWCSDDSGKWQHTQHTARQARRVQEDLAGHLQDQQSRYAALLARINSATTVSEAEAIAW